MIFSPQELPAIPDFTRFPENSGLPQSISPMRYSNVRLVLNSDLMGVQWLAIRRKARRLFPGVTLEEREGVPSDRLVLSVHSNAAREAGKEAFTREPLPGIARFEALLRSGFASEKSAFKPEIGSAGQVRSSVTLPGDVARELLC